MTSPNDPSGGWAPPQQQAPQQPAQAGWAPPQHPPTQQPAQAGWGPPPTSTAWNGPAGASNQKAAWGERSPNEPSAIDFFFKPPASLEGTGRTLYILLTVASIPLLVPAFFLSFLYALRRGFRYQNSTGIKIYAHLIATLLFYGVCSTLGAGLGLPGMAVGIPLTLLAWIPLGGRYLLPKFMS